MAGSCEQGAFSERFAGFALPTSNTTYTPNQFFDVCLPHASRGCVRLVSVLIRKTLGWCDAHGRPQQEQIRLSYADLEAAGISRAMIKTATAEAIRRQFVRCVRTPQPKLAGRPPVTALYELNWDESAEYVKEPARFRGFFAGDGNRTYIPNRFFDHVVTNEPLAVIKVVGAVVRFSIGFANKWGHRRTFASLSYSDIQRYTKLRDRKSLAEALRAALRENYVERVELGYFDPRGGLNSRPATYALKWLNKAADSADGLKSPPETTAMEKSVQTPPRDRFENPTGDRFEIPTGIQIKQNKTPKQQQDAVPFKKKHEQDPAATAAAIATLREQGFDPRTAERLATAYPIDRVLRQTDWIDSRRVRQNRLGMLRVAIEEDWPKPGAAATQLRRRNSRPDERAADPLSEARERLTKRFNPFES